jgi:hypothetical protein
LRRICLTPGVEQDEDREDHDERAADGQDAGGAEAAGEQARDRGSGRGEVAVTPGARPAGRRARTAERRTPAPAAWRGRCGRRSPSAPGERLRR